jgi:glycerophosphoryl diester phosphodiesterase
MELQNKVIAHRGAWKTKGLPQNSIASLQEAIRLQCGGSEFDVRMTSDKVPIVVHDDTENGLALEVVTYHEITRHKANHAIPTLEKYLTEGIKQQFTKLILEIKSSSVSKEHDFELTEMCLDLVDKLGAKRWVDYIAFDYDVLQHILRLDATARVYYLGSDIAPKQLKQDGFYGFDYHITALKQNPQWIEEAQNLGLLTNAWTVNTIDEMKWLLANGINFITTDTPEDLLKIIQSV